VTHGNAGAAARAPAGAIQAAPSADASVASNTQNLAVAKFIGIDQDRKSGQRVAHPAVVPLLGARRASLV